MWLKSKIKFSSSMMIIEMLLLLLYHSGWSKWDHNEMISCFNSFHCNLYDQFSQTLFFIENSIIIIHNRWWVLTSNDGIEYLKNHTDRLCIQWKLLPKKNRIKFSLNYLFCCCSWFGKIRFILHDRIDIIVVMVEDSFLIFNFWSIINFLRNSIHFQFLIRLDFLVCLVSWAIILCVICVCVSFSILVDKFNVSLLPKSKHYTFIIS